MKEMILAALRRYIVNGNVALFDDANIPTIGDDSFLVALSDGHVFRIEVQQQAGPDTPPLHYCPCGRSIEATSDHCQNCNDLHLNQNREALDY